MGQKQPSGHGEGTGTVDKLKLEPHDSAVDPTYGQAPASPCQVQFGFGGLAIKCQTRVERVAAHGLAVAVAKLFQD